MAHTNEFFRDELSNARLIIYNQNICHGVSLFPQVIDESPFPSGSGKSSPLFDEMDRTSSRISSLVDEPFETK
jgi:hypothetical protein